MSVTLEPSIQAPVALGAPIHWSASIDQSDAGEIWYRFRVRPFGGEYRTIRDFGPLAELDWAAAEREGTYEMELTARNVSTGELAVSTALVEITSQVVNGKAAVTATPHPLVFLYSAPACETGQRIRAEFAGPDGVVRQTPFKACRPWYSSNFYLAGLYAETDYVARHVVERGTERAVSENIPFRTGSIPVELYPPTVTQPAVPSASNQVLLNGASGAPTATDLNGNILWYATGVQTLTRAEQNGYFWTILEGDRNRAQNVIRKIDLTGATVIETNAARVNEQLVALGRREISGFHHEALTLPDGRIAVLAGVEQILEDVQGPGPIDILGDMIIVLDADLNVVWTWDAFDHLDVRRKAVLGQTCAVGGGCPPWYLAPDVNDWTHGNSIQPTPDGHLLFSSRHQDWLIKIDYSRGLGDGHVIWRLGREGDFRILSDDPFPWFSHQHDGNYDPSDPTMLLVFDNGNTRIREIGGNSRGQVLQLDEENRTATLALNADLGVQSLAVGSAQRLANGNYHFDAGFVRGPEGLITQAIEVDRLGAIVYNATTKNVTYRSFRLTDMYTPW
jgi:hypothetical protein